SMGFLGHAVNGGVDWGLCIIAGVAIVAGSQIGSHLHARINEKNLRLGLAAILVFAALWMILRSII
ncbi:MAG: sulfite exporter TauE/SafE family protein, partial [Thermoplasmata archaeon]|nr:sulfite exporter TauE/SafE family protein [Thermoplasmata archaeon]